MITGGGTLLEQNRKPKWRGSASLTWSLANVTVGSFVQYTGRVFDTGLTYDDGTLEGTSIRVGARNLFDSRPPLWASGYEGALYAPYRR